MNSENGNSCIVSGLYSLEGGLIMFCEVSCKGVCSPLHHLMDEFLLKHHSDERGHSLWVIAKQPNISYELEADQLTQHTVCHCFASPPSNKDHHQILWINGNTLWKNNGDKHCNCL